MPRCRQIELLSPQQERFLADAAATVPAPFRDDFEADVRDRLGEWPTGGDVCDQCVARLVSGAQAFGGAMNPQLDDDSPLDPNGLLRDGKVLRVRMHARDSNTVRGQIAAANRAAIHDGHHSEFGLYRPGPRHNDAVDRSLCEQAYDAMCRASSEVWKSGPGQQSDASPPATPVAPMRSG